jgi:signal peptidase II
LKKSLIIIFIILLADQILKFWIKLNMTIGEEFHVFGDWFIIHFTENEGMAFGLSFGGEFGKLALSLFRIVAIAAISWYLWDLIKKKMPFGLILSITLILAGAIGNLIDSAFYGLIFSHSSYHTRALFLPEAGGYSSFLHGKVVDMFYFPVIQGYYPVWIPFWGGQEFIFFRPVFNIADSSITVGVLMLILFQRKYFIHTHKDEDSPQDKAQDENSLPTEEESGIENGTKTDPVIQPEKSG